MLSNFLIVTWIKYRVVEVKNNVKSVLPESLRIDNILSNKLKKVEKYSTKDKFL